MPKWSKEALEELGPGLRSAIEPAPGLTTREYSDATCPVCKERFKRRRDWQRFCRPQCREEWYGRRRYPMKAACEQCGELFLVKRPWQKFCKPDCRIKAFLIAKAEKRKQFKATRIRR
jgi:hypothetical protein